jgi:muconolactone delta-isomerase
MQILAIENEVPGVSEEAFKPLLKEEAKRVYDLYQAGVIRATYFRRDGPGAVLLFECDGVKEANEIISSLPLVKAKLVAFDVIPLAPYPGFARLFTEEFL